MKIIWLAVSICFLIALGGGDCGGAAGGDCGGTAGGDYGGTANDSARHSVTKAMGLGGGTAGGDYGGTASDSACHTATKAMGCGKAMSEEDLAKEEQRCIKGINNSPACSDPLVVKEFGKWVLCILNKCTVSASPNSEDDFNQCVKEIDLARKESVGACMAAIDNS